MTNNVIRNIYAYRYEAGTSSLRVEDGQGQGFESWPINKLLKGLSREDEKKFIPGILTGEYLAIYQDILKLI